jgi:hypothetical protein
MLSDRGSVSRQTRGVESNVQRRAFVSREDGRVGARVEAKAFVRLSSVRISRRGRDDWEKKDAREEGRTHGFELARGFLGAGTSQRTRGPKLGAVRGAGAAGGGWDVPLELVGEVPRAGLRVEAADEEDAGHGGGRRGE